VSRIFLDKKLEDHLPIYRVEDLFRGNSSRLEKLCKAMVKKNRLSTVKGICLRNNLEGYQTLDYDETWDDGLPPLDSFGPISKKESCLSLNPGVEVIFVSNIMEIE
jgi:hypothetical protein